MSPTLRWLGFLSLVGWGCVYLVLFGWFRAHSQDFIVERRSATLCAGSVCGLANLPMQWSTSGENASTEPLVAGWGRPESDGTWSVQREAAIHLPVGFGRSGCLAVKLRVAAAGQAGQMVRLNLADRERDQPVLDWWVQGQGMQKETTLVVPASATDERGVLRLRLEFPDAYRPAMRTNSPDTRLLGVKLSRLEVVELESRDSSCGMTVSMTQANSDERSMMERAGPGLVTSNLGRARARVR